VQKLRGAIGITDRAILEREACERYRIISTEYQRLFDGAEHLPAA
jgi:hypothetical protein